MSEPRKFKHVLDWADSEWTVKELTDRIAGIIGSVPAEYRASARIELVRCNVSASYLAVTVVMTHSFDYTDSGWEPA